MCIRTKANAANVDAIAELFTELADASEQRSRAVDAATKTTSEQLLEAAVRSEPALLPRATSVDARIFVPHFSVRIEGRAPLAAPPMPASLPASKLLAGSPMVYLAGPPQLLAGSALSRGDRVERWKEKRKVRSFAPREPDACVSDTRRACAAKRQRVKGRFTREKCAFVPITALQPDVLL